MRIIVALACALLSLAAAAQMYSWKDASGKTQYSDQPPPDKTPVRRVAPPPPPSANAGEQRKEAADKQMDDRAKQKGAREAAAKAEKDKAGAEDRARNCDKAKGNLQAIESGQARFTVDAKGERVALDGAVREAEIASARKAVDDWCK